MSGVTENPGLLDLAGFPGVPWHHLHHFPGVSAAPRLCPSLSGEAFGSNGLHQGIELQVGDNTETAPCQDACLNGEMILKVGAR